MMKRFIHNKLAAVLGTAVLAASISAPANAAVVLGGENGWSVSYGGFINLFYNYNDFHFNGGSSEKSSHLNEGLLPSFHTMTVKTPEVNGLKGTGQITFAVDASGSKSQRLNKGGQMIDMREVFFNVEGSFGTISAGRTLSLFQRQAILKDMTLFGMGALAGPDGGGTGLGRIGFGYVYPDFRTRFTYKTPDINGFNLEVGVFDPQEPGSGGVGWETSTPQFQAEATYTTEFQGGSVNFWAGFLWQTEKNQALNSDVDSTGYNGGIDVTFGGFNVVGSYYGGKALGTWVFNLGGGDGFMCGTISCKEFDNDGYYIQGSYTFMGKTKVGVSYGQSNQDGISPATVAALGAPATVLDPTGSYLVRNGERRRNTLLTVGVYHDVNSWLKVIAEYNMYRSNQLFGYHADGFSVGGFLLW
jgi:hypothetical protein